MFRIFALLAIDTTLIVGAVAIVNNFGDLYQELPFMDFFILVVGMIIGIAMVTLGLVFNIRKWLDK